ncbi:hypothetical protein EIB71_02465 [Kaistella daneshvariae]|uniref:Uncharacterized protein n=1 Tax=Kaistella daneshvariae TaxID=2487074 RepID=A0ABN5SW24_9FLAO|nr:hypothetical protein [Kaistella daneshvariae]AZI66611.1 hypothetical protein EIB71_02465 [Kaistella daneshvariae]
MKKSITILSILFMFFNSCRNDSEESQTPESETVLNKSMFEVDSASVVPAQEPDDDPPPRKDLWPWFNAQER